MGTYIQPRVDSNEYYFNISKGLIPGHTWMQKFGQNTDIDTGGTFEDITEIGGKYTFLSAAETHNVVSTSIEDAGTTVSSGTATGGSYTTLEDTGATFISDGVVAGDLLLNDTNIDYDTILTVDSETKVTVERFMTCPNDGFLGAMNISGDSYRIIHNAVTGASVIHILGQLITRLEAEEFVVMNGTTNVAMVQDYVRMYRGRLFGATAGNSGGIGTITVTAPSGPYVQLQITNGNNQTLQAVYTVPADKIGYITRFWATSQSKVAGFNTVNFRAGAGDRMMYLLQSFGLATSGSSNYVYQYDVYSPVPGGIDLLMEADASANNMSVSAGFDIILVDV